MYEIKIANEEIVTKQIIDLKKKKIIPERAVLNKAETTFKDDNFLCKLQITDECSFNPLLLPAVKKALDDSAIILNDEDSVMLKKIDGHYKVIIPVAKQIIEKEIRKFPVDGLDSNGVDPGLTAADQQEFLLRKGRIYFNPILNLPSVKNVLRNNGIIINAENEKNIELQQNNNQWELVIITPEKEINHPSKEIQVDGVEEDLHSSEVLQKLLEGKCKRETTESYQELIRKGYNFKLYVAPPSPFIFFSNRVALLIEKQLEVIIAVDQETIENEHVKCNRYKNQVSLERCEKNGVKYCYVQDNDAIRFQIDLTDNQVKMLNLLEKFYTLCYPTSGWPRCKFDGWFIILDAAYKWEIDKKEWELRELTRQHLDEFNQLRKVLAPYFSDFTDKITHQFCLVPLAHSHILMAPPNNAATQKETIREDIKHRGDL